MTLPTFRNEPTLDFADPRHRADMELALAKARRVLGRKYPLQIRGKKLPCEATFTSVNPANPEEIIGTFPACTAEHAEEAIHSVAQKFEWWAAQPVELRAGVLLRAAQLIRRQRMAFNALMVLEVGKTWAEADADTAEAIDFLEFYAREALRLAGEHPTTPYPGESNEVWYRPIGIVAVIAPWNFPCAIFLGMVVAALVTGNVVVAKPAEESPAIAHLVVDTLKAAGLPTGVLELLTGFGPEVGEPLVVSPHVAAVNFTGSKNVGLHIYQEAAKLRPGQQVLKRLIAEMGGKDTIIVDEEVDLEAAVNGVVQSAFGFAGQKCSACSRVVVVKGVYEAFCAALAAKVNTLRVGSPEEYPTNVGPVINAEAKARCERYIAIGQEEGKLLLRLNAPSGGYYVGPTVFRDVNPEGRLAMEEVFGPVLAVIPAKTFQKAVSIANSGEYGLTGGVYSNNREHLLYARKHFFVGNLYINRKCTGALVDVQPFGGFKLSGTNSKAGGRDYLKLFLQAQSISERF